MATSRADLLAAVLPSHPALDAAIQHVVSGSQSSPPPPQVPPDLVQKAVLANHLADLTDDNEPFVKKVLQDPSVSSMRDVAFKYNTAASSSIASSPQTSNGSQNSGNSTPIKQLDVPTFQTRLFHAEPSAVLHRMVEDKQINMPPETQSGVSKFFANQPSFNIRTTSVLGAVQQPGALDGVPIEHTSDTVDKLKTIQRVQALAPSPDAVAPLLNSGLQSAFQVAQIPKAKFVTQFETPLGKETALQVHAHAVASSLRNDKTLVQIFQTIKGSRLAAIDGNENIDTRIATFRQVAEKNSVQIDLEALFGGLDFCDCPDCTSVTSPANYFVELLQYLRNNDLDPEGAPQKYPNTGQKGITGTALEVLLRRRPDLQHLQLTCENANTLIPYIDLANEVMESFIVHLDTYPKIWTDTSQDVIDVFNVTVETSNELLAEPQHTNYKAYCILLQAVYPLGSLPFHQPIAAIRIYLNYLKTSRYEVINTFRKPSVTPTATPPYSTADSDALLQLHGVIVDRASAAEYLGIIQEEYIILTKEAFWPKQYFEITARNALTDADYQKDIGVRATREYWGFDTNDEMTSQDETLQIGLEFVKTQFLPRSGMLYTDLVNLVKTHYVNPVYPTGQALVILESIRFSYRFLQTLINTTATNKKDKYGLLIDFLFAVQPWVKRQIKTQSVDQAPVCEPTFCREDIARFVYQWFKCLGKIVVLESGEGPTLPVSGLVVIYTPPPVIAKPPALEMLTTNSITQSHAQISSSDYKVIGTLYEDGTITDNTSGNSVYSGSIIGSVAIDSKAYAPDNTLFMAKYAGQEVDILPFVSSTANSSTQSGQTFTVNFAETGLLNWYNSDGKLVRWNAVVDSCNIDTVRIVHLDGNPLLEDSWDRLQRFIRLWKRLGWTIDETDKALAGLATAPPQQPLTPPTPTSAAPDPDPIVGFGDFAPQHCGSSEKDGDCASCSRCGKPVVPHCKCDEIPDDICKSVVPIEITPYFINEVFNVKKLQDATGMELIKLLALWANISTAGDTSLYSRLFLTHNLIGVDPVFTADNNGNYLTTSTKISDHMPVILAALRLTPDGLSAILQQTKLSGMDLTQTTISEIYRYALLAQNLLIKVPLLIEATQLFGDPFEDALSTESFITAYNLMVNLGFTVQQLTYVILGTDDPVRPLGPKKTTILKTAKTLFDGLNSIDTAHPDLAPDAVVTADIVSQNTTLIFDSKTVASINSFLAGTLPFTTNVPIGLTLTIPASLSSKISYTDPKTAIGTNRRATLTVTGLLTDNEISLAKSLAPGQAWSDAVDRAKKAALTYFNNTLFGIFQDQAAATAVLLAGDVAAAADGTSPGSAPAKQLYFLQNFLPYLRDQLSNQLVISTMAGEAGISSNDITLALLSSILSVGKTSTSPGTSALSILRGLQNAPPGTTNDWTGYLVPSTSDSYTFVGFGDSKPAPLIIDSVPLPFKYQQDDPNDVWMTDAIALTGGRLYFLDAGGQTVPGLQWKTARSPASAVPSSALLPDYSTNAATTVFTMLAKAAIIINGFQLTIDEINYFQSHGSDFSSFDLNNIGLDAWEKAAEYTNLRNSLPPGTSTLLGLFKWTVSLTAPPTVAQIAAQISASTGWVSADVETLIGPKCFNMGDLALYRNETALVKIQTALKIVGNIGVDIQSLFKWAEPMAKFWPTHGIAEDIRKAIRSRFSLDDWEQVAKPLQNNLRMKQRDALIAYLVVQPVLIQWGVVDADSLFEFFLIDVQMGACLQTSRLKQAISAVQSFVQRCILGLEEEKTPSIANDALDQVRWNWMSKQTIWTANRKVFLTPEDYLVASLRDDKTALYSTLENELQQKDINPQALQDSIKSYLFGLDQVANLLVVGLFEDDSGNDPSNTLYIVARTRSAPYLYFHRTFAKASGVWAPWQPVSVDIPTYHVDSWMTKVVLGDDKKTVVTPAKTMAACDGNYVIPFVLGQRLMLFYAQFTLKTLPQSDPAAVKLAQPTTVGDVQRWQTWEIKLGWSEFRNGKWSQKQVTTDSVMDPKVDSTTTWNPDGAIAPPMESYLFIPSLVSVPLSTGGTSTVSDDHISIVILDSAYKIVGGFEFHGSQVFGVSSPPTPVYSWTTPTQFHFKRGAATTTTTSEVTPTMYSYQVTAGGFKPLSRNYVEYPLDSMSTSSFVTPSTSGGSPVSIPFYHEFSNQLLSIINATVNLDPLYHYYSTEKDGDGQAFGSQIDTQDSFSSYNELSTPYALYNWEVGFHTPLELADTLLQNQQFDNALSMCHYVFDPYADGPTTSRVWKWVPFANVNPQNVLEALFNSLQPRTPNDQINTWRNNPFAPHVVARDRPVAYMKWTVMKYLQILIAYGDYYFRQNTLEAVPLAIQCYILASHIYGPRGQQIPKRGKVEPQSYFSLLDKWDAFGNAVVDLELAFPFSNQTPHPVEFSGNDVVLANIFGFATTHYFSIPDNPQLGALRDLIDDRLYKIRHCQDINGNAISLALWEPPIDPALLVAAVAEGLSLSNFLNDLNSPMPNYRFYYLLQKALDLCSEMKNMGSSFLTVKEKRDSEALQLLRANQENTIQTLVMQVRNLQLDEANKSLDALRTSRSGPLARYTYYTSLAGATAAALTELDPDYSPITLAITPPTTEGDMVLSDAEKNEVDEAGTARTINADVGGIETFAAGCFAWPKIGEKAEPWGLGFDLVFGPDNIGRAATAFARFLRNFADDHSYNSTNSSRKATYIRQYQERVQMANNAGFELANINTQMVIQQTRITTAAQEITNQQKQIDNTADVVEFLKSKYTNDDLYAWIENSVRTLFYQTYTMAYDLAKKAEAAYIFERGPQASPFIQFGYWDASHDGLQSAEQLYVALKRLEAAYQTDRGYDFELVKSVSLRQLNPFALLQLRETATCNVDLPEVLFDMDFPGHYSRRIKSIALTIPCVVGPYTSLNCTLKLLSHQYRISPMATDVNSYTTQQDGGPQLFQTVNVPINSIAVCSGQNDSGVFELNFKDERYLPFEGAGVISKWEIDLPDTFRQFDYDTITDVIMTIRYTSLNGGDKLKKPASDSVAAYIKSVETLSQTQGLFTLFDLQSEFATEWARASSPLPTSTPPATSPTTRILTLKNLANRLPAFTRRPAGGKILATDITMLTETALTAPDLTLTTDLSGSGNTDDVTFVTGTPPTVGDLNVFSQSGLEAPITSWAVNIGGDPTLALKKIWLLVRYTLN